AFYWLVITVRLSNRSNRDAFSGFRIYRETLSRFSSLHRSNRDAFSGFRIYRETLSRFSCAASTG
ncbi:hypothetical protein ACB371_18885, partial [Klebsiella pneumoniae]